MRRSGWVQTGHVKRNESCSRTWLGRDPRYPDHCSRSASFLCQEFKLDTTTLHPQPLKLAPRLPNRPGDTPLFHGTLFDRAARLVFVFKENQEASIVEVIAASLQKHGYRRDRYVSRERGKEEGDKRA